ncbi:hypothetical protein BJX61DRAFT_534388 [Aspergillus egyptiacus]|nr:hypothetical protein BJX61DRAFT_534388 [Aspergillus egyptiacus]
MSNPLSPLTTNRQNLQALSSDFGDSPAKRASTDILLAAGIRTENSPLGSKRLADDEHRNSLGHGGTGYEVQGQQNDDEDVLLYGELQSSPFRVDVKDSTVDLQNMRKYTSSMGLNEHSATPRKRSYDQAPDVYDVEIEEKENERYKKGMARKDVSDIDIYADEDSGYDHEQELDDAVGQDIAGSTADERWHEGVSAVNSGDSQDGSSGFKEEPDADDTDNAMMDDDIHDPMDDTCLSTFSAVPNVDMTAFANIRGGSPFKSPRPLPDRPIDDDTNSENIKSTSPHTGNRSPRKGTLFDMSSPAVSPTPKKRDTKDDQGASATPNLLDLTDHTGLFPRHRYSLQAHERYSPSRRSPLRIPRETIRSPAKMSLLDFDIPAAPTPRSIPIVTPRELESLKSGFLSEISSLKATLSGKEAEVSSLKQAVADAERRVGEALEEVRNEAARKEALEVEQVEWQRRGRDMEEVLRTVKADIVEGERERERLLKKNEEAEKGREQLEGRIVELETQLAAARKSAACEHGTSGDPTLPAKSADETAKEIQDAVEKVARDLHTLYKEKHETKVAALKKSYEARWEKRLREAEKKLKAATEEGERLRAERDAALQESARPDTSMMMRENEEHEAEKRVLESQIKGLEQEMASLRNDSEHLRVELNAERAEKGDLVALVEEWLSMQNQPGQPPQPRNEKVTPEPLVQEPVRPTPEAPERDITRSSSSGSRGPSSSSISASASNHRERKIPRIGAPVSRHGRGNSGGKSGIAVFTPGRSGIMGSIERMGRGSAA